MNRILAALSVYFMVLTHAHANVIQLVDADSSVDAIQNTTPQTTQPNAQPTPNTSTPGGNCTENNGISPNGTQPEVQSNNGDIPADVSSNNGSTPALSM